MKERLESDSQRYLLFKKYATYIHNFHYDRDYVFLLNDCMRQGWKFWDCLFFVRIVRVDLISIVLWISKSGINCVYFNKKNCSISKNWHGILMEGNNHYLFLFCIFISLVQCLLNLNFWQHSLHNFLSMFE